HAPGWVQLGATESTSKTIHALPRGTRATPHSVSCTISGFAWNCAVIVEAILGVKCSSSQFSVPYSASLMRHYRMPTYPWLSCGSRSEEVGSVMDRALRKRDYASLSDLFGGEVRRLSRRTATRRP